MADYKSILDQVYQARDTKLRNPMESLQDAADKQYEQNFFALSPLASRPWDVPELPERQLTPEQIDTVLGLVNPPKEPLWSSLLSTGAPADTSVSEKVSAKVSSKGPINTAVPTDMGAVPPTTPLDFTDKEMEEALAGQREGMKGLAIARAGAQIGRALAGSSAEGPAFAGLDELVKAPASDLERKRQAEYQKFTREKEMVDKKEAADPNSAHSVSYRNLAKSMLDMQGLSNISKAIDGLSAEQIDKKFPMISNIVTAKMAQDTKRETAAMLKATKEESKLDKAEFRHQDWLTNQLERELKSKQFEGINKVFQASTNIDDALTNPSAIKDIGVLYNFIKSIDENSAVREGEVKLGREALSAMENIKLWSSNFSKKDKRLLTPDAIREVKILNEAAKKAASEAYMKRVNFVRNQGLDRGIPAERLDRSLGTMMPEIKAQAAPKGYSEAQERGIERVMKDNNISRDKAIEALKKAGKL